MKTIRVSVDDALCTACGLCEERAPENIEVPAGEPAAEVIKQPSGEVELEACFEASEYCPTGGLIAQEVPGDESRSGALHEPDVSDA